MPHTLRARFKPTPVDYMNATLAFFFAQRSMILLAIISTLFVVMAVPISLIYRAQGSTVATFILLIALGYLLIAVATVAAPLIRIRRVAMQNETMLAETTWSIDAERIDVRNRYEKTELVWGMFNWLIVTRQFVLLVYAENKRQFTFLPKRAFSSQADQTAFLRLAKEKLA